MSAFAMWSFRSSAAFRQGEQLPTLLVELQFASQLLRRQPACPADRELGTPRSEVRVVEPLPSQQRLQRAALAAGHRGLGCPNNPELLGCREPAT